MTIPGSRGVNKKGRTTGGLRNNRHTKAVGQFVMPRVLRGAGKLETRGVLLTLAISFCLFLAWAASKVELAPIVVDDDAGE